MEDEFLKGIEQEFCNGCVLKEECHTPCPHVIREILGLSEEGIL